MKKFVKRISSYILKNKIKTIFIFLSIYIFIILITFIFNNFVRTPGNLDFYLYGDKYQEIINIFSSDKDISMISYSELHYGGARCKNPLLKNNNFSTVNQLIGIPDSCDNKFIYIFDKVRKLNIAYFMKISNSEIVILTNSLYSNILETSYIYSKGYFKNRDEILNKKENGGQYIKIINDDWAVFQKLK